MKHIFCNVLKNDSSIILKPYDNYGLEYNYEYNNEHISTDTNIDFISDIRNYIINNSINSKLNIYLIFYDSLNLAIEPSNLSAVSYIVTYDRSKIKTCGKRTLEYSIEDAKTYDTEVIDYDNRRLIYLGETSKLNFRETAYEVAGCMSPIISESGCGYISVSLITDRLINASKACLILSKDKLIPTEPKIDSPPIAYPATTTAPIAYAEPTAPPIEYIETPSVSFYNEDSIYI